MLVFGAIWIYLATGGTPRLTTAAFPLALLSPNPASPALGYELSVLHPARKGPPQALPGLL